MTLFISIDILLTPFYEHALLLRYLCHDVQLRPGDLLSLNACNGHPSCYMLLPIGLCSMIVQLGPHCISFYRFTQYLYLHIRDPKGAMRRPRVSAHQQRQHCANRYRLRSRQPSVKRSSRQLPLQKRNLLRQPSYMSGPQAPHFRKIRRLTMPCPTEKCETSSWNGRG